MNAIPVSLGRKRTPAEIVQHISEQMMKGELTESERLAFATSLGIAAEDLAGHSVQPEWCRRLPLQQQSVLLLAARGPDGINKDHPCKEIQRAYRATVLVAARYGRMLRLNGEGDSFMSLAAIIEDTMWDYTVDRFLHTIDDLPHHFIMHLMHGAEILGYKHPERWLQERWLHLYFRMCEDMHLATETEGELDTRLCDWDRASW